jgi:hypothetical protein
VLQDVYPRLKRAFSNSVYPAATVNLGRAVSDRHRDVGNAPAVPCAITAFGAYNYKLGGHLILFDLKVILEFPPGCTILVPSGGFDHGNTEIQPGESRHSLIQYCAGGLARWVAYGFKKWDDLSPAEQASELAKRSSRWQEVMELFSTVESLPGDREAFNARL